MSMLTHRLERPIHSADEATILGTLATTAGRFCLQLFAILSTGSVLTLLIALKTAAHLWRFHP
ncbi:hypothetical protein C2U70_19265 [Bradyrhizobium guangdongense]|uniref:hypothetical protein n=1 Tax=Bradyrhizobium guangdongense TaxID=1325090 RepID=UPI00112800F8|nr:hypothetical protein [Bradyrhizobium guangdongense]TPQ33451.1 hypothetical protein C2U70_19265 [Bradyrhizobium guangdongense]